MYISKWEVQSESIELQRRHTNIELVNNIIAPICQKKIMSEYLKKKKKKYNFNHFVKWKYRYKIQKVNKI